MVFSFIRFSQFASAAVRPLFLGQPFCKTGELLEQQEGGAQVLQCPFGLFLVLFVQRRTAQCSVELSRDAPIIV